jgi:very-short-patch-repair endonuclease
MVDRTSTRIANRARALRKGMTEPEIMLWSRLKGRVEGRPIFRRQYAYETIIFDFYCPAAKLVVEIDGRTHWDDAAQAKDDARDFWLASRGIAVMRVGAGEVYRNLGRVADGVIRTAEARIPSRTAGD